MPYNDAILKDDDRIRVQALGDQWRQYKATGDTAGMERAHNEAEAIRAQYGYSGGADGSGYKQTGTNTMAYNDDIMNADDKARIDALGQQWRHYTALGNTAAAQQAHDQAEAIRARYGYSGGADGSGYIQTGMNTVLRTATPQTEAIENAYQAQIAADQAAIDAANNQKMLDFDYAAQQIAPTYNTQRQNTAAQYQIGQRNMAERFNALGLGNGAQGQMYLSQDNEYQRNMNALNAAEAKARTDLEFERLKARTAYQDAVAQAIREGDAAKAKALYQEAIRVDEALVSSSANQINIDLQREATQWNRAAEQADTLAKYGDFSGYAALGYSPEQIADMRRVWEAMNPDLMALMGYGGYAAGGSSGGSGGSGGSGSGKGGSGNGGSGKKTEEQVRPGTKKGTQQYLGNSKQSSVTSFSYAPDEGIFTWNGKNYGNKKSLEKAVANKAMTDSELAALKKKFKSATGTELNVG